MKSQRFFILSFIAFICIGWGQFVFAVDYYWWVSGLDGQKFPSPKAACDARGNQLYPGPVQFKYASSTVELNYNSTSAVCTPIIIIDGNPRTVSLYTVFRDGTTCTDPAVFNPATGSCEAPEPDKCESSIDQIITHQHKLGSIGGARTPPPGSICENECQYAFTDTPPKDVYRFVNPEADQLDNAYGKYEYKGNGVECTGGDTSNPNVFDQPPTQPPIDKKPELSHEQKCDEWVTGPDGVTRRSCTSKNEYKDPGTLKCEDTNGFLACTPGKPSPDLQKTDKTELTEKETNADGSTKTETTTTTDKTVCKGAKPCTSTTATEKETSGTKPDGTPGDSKTECTGTGCKDSLGGSEDGKDEEDEEEEGTPREVSIGSCDAPVSCSGDAIDCAVLQEEKTQRCLAEDQADYPKYASEIESQLTAEEYQLEKQDIQVPGLLENSTRFLPSSCPPPKQVSLSGGTNITLEFDLFCSFASAIAPIIVALALLFGALYVGRSFGGG